MGTEKTAELILNLLENISSLTQEISERVYDSVSTL